MARVVPRDKIKVPSHPGGISSHPRIISPFIHLKLKGGDETGIFRVDTATQGVETPHPPTDC